jgi:hypothetical protein
MSEIARVLAGRLAAAGVDASVLAARIRDMPETRVEAINHEGLQAQVAYLLEAYGPTGIEIPAFGNPPREEWL